MLERHIDVLGVDVDVARDHLEQIGLQRFDEFRRERQGVGEQNEAQPFLGFDTGWLGAKQAGEKL